MSAPAIGAATLAFALLAALAYGPELAAAIRRPLGVRGARRGTRDSPGPHGRRLLGSGRGPAGPRWDPGRELRAERRARQLLADVVPGEELAMYEELGFVAVPGAGEEDSGYAYLVYPHRPIVAYDTERGELLNEYCVGFPDTADPDQGGRLPAADDVLAKWIALTGDEHGLIAVANMHLPGRQVDPGQVCRDLIRLREWRAARRVRSAA